MLIQFDRPVLAATTKQSDRNLSLIHRKNTTPSTEKEKDQMEKQQQMLRDYELEIMELRKKLLEIPDHVTALHHAHDAHTVTVEKYTENEKKAELKYKTLEQEYADMETKKNTAIANLEKTKNTITELEIMQKTNTDLEKTNTILSWIIFGLCIALFITICLLRFKYKCCAEPTVKEIIPEVTADRPTRTSLQFMQPDEQKKKRSVKKRIPTRCKIPTVTADRPTRTSLAFLQDHEDWSSTSMSNSTLFGTETREIAKHHFQPTSSSDHTYASTESLFLPKPNDLRSNQHFRRIKSSHTLSNNDL